MVVLLPVGLQRDRCMLVGGLNVPLNGPSMSPSMRPRIVLVVVVFVVHCTLALFDQLPSSQRM